MPRRPRRYSIFSILREARRGHAGWQPAWRKAEPKPAYDIVIVGGGGHGLATACYLAREHGIRDVAVIEKGWLGGGNTARNTTIIRSNYLRPESMALYGLSHRLYETLSTELNLNVLFSPRGLLDLAFTTAELELRMRTADANSHAGIESWVVPPREVQSLVPLLDLGPGKRHVLQGALFQPRGGVARHDAVAWGYARMASALGVDIIEGCEVAGLTVERDTIAGVETDRGRIGARTVVVAAASDTPAIVAGAGVMLPIKPVPLQAFVTEPVKPLLDVVVTSGSGYGYVSQADKGEFVIGGRTDTHTGHTRRGAPEVIEETAAGMIELFPFMSRLRMMRQWAGTVDLTPDRSPLIGTVGPAGLWINCGWGTGGFKAIPGSGWAMAASLAAGRPHPLVAPFTPERFAQGRPIEEGAAAAVLH